MDDETPYHPSDSVWPTAINGGTMKGVELQELHYLLSHGLDCIIHTLLGIILPSYLYFTVLDCWLAISKGNM